MEFPLILDGWVLCEEPVIFFSFEFPNNMLLLLRTVLSAIIVNFQIIFPFYYQTEVASSHLPSAISSCFSHTESV